MEEGDSEDDEGSGESEEDEPEDVAYDEGLFEGETYHDDEEEDEDGHEGENDDQDYDEDADDDLLDDDLDEESTESTACGPSSPRWPWNDEKQQKRGLLSYQAHCWFLRRWEKRGKPLGRIDIICEAMRKQYPKRLLHIKSIRCAMAANERWKLWAKKRRGRARNRKETKRRVRKGVRSTA